MVNSVTSDGEVLDTHFLKHDNGAKCLDMYNSDKLDNYVKKKIRESSNY